ncbi:MAG: hypothetical protein NT150_03165 [Bacteroidetes bacterium]|nr:hypothetical protein [Bacteroidota bacterium]
MTKQHKIQGFKFLFFAVLLFAFFNSCEKNEGSSIYKVWYLLELPKKFDANITYYSDKYAATGKLETIHITDTTYSPFQATLSENAGKINVWFASHLQKDRSLPYSIEAQFNDSTKFDFTGNKKYVMMVFANDTTLIDSVQFKPTFNKIKLEGKIP